MALFIFKRNNFAVCQKNSNFVSRKHPAPVLFPSAQLKDITTAKQNT